MSSCQPWGSKAALKKEGPESGAIGAKGLRVPGGTTRTHQGGQAEATEQVFGQGDLWVLPGHRRSGDRLWSHQPGLRVIC